jgi:tetratricopeptide (TPR) repeat protein
VRSLLVLCVLASAAFAGPKEPTIPQKADALFEKGQASYQAGNYQEAIDEFKQAFELVKDPVYLFNIAQSYRKVADCVNASDFYNRYLTEAPNAENKDKVAQWIHELQPCVDQRKEEQEAARRGAEAERQRKAEEERKRQEAAKPVEVEVDRGKTLRIAGLATGAVGLAGIAVGITYGIKGKNIKKEVADECARGCQWDSDAITSRNDAGKRANTLAEIGYIAGGVATLAGVGLYIFGTTRVEHVMVTPNAGGASVSATLSF